MANEVMQRHVSRGDLNSLHQQKAPAALIGKASWEIGWTKLKNAPDFIFPPVISD